MASLEEIRVERLKKLDALKAHGIAPYPSKIARDVSLLDAKARFLAYATEKTPLTLAKLKTKLVKRHFLVDSTKAGLYLSRLQYNYEVELSQEKVKKHYLLTTRYYINPLSIDTYHADYVTPSNLAKKDLKKSIY